MRHLEVYGNIIEMSQIKFKKKKKTGNTPADGNTKGVKIALLLKYLSNFWRTLEMPLIDCEIILILTWSADCVISSATGGKICNI